MYLGLHQNLQGWGQEKKKDVVPVKKELTIQLEKIMLTHNKTREQDHI